MSEQEAAHGLNCPQCGGMVPVPEGQLVVQCPFCNLRSLVRGERGLQRYQVLQRVDRQKAREALRGFLGNKLAIARDAARRAVLEDAFLAHLPFWTSWAKALGWVFGQKRVGSGDRARYEPREVRSTAEMTWNGAACDVGEFGVEEVPLAGRPLEAFNPEHLHQSGLVFEPVGSASQARQASEEDFNRRVESSSGLDRVSQVFVRLVQRRMGLVYYPLWVLRYLYRGRSFQVVVDGFSGEVLYGKAPGSTFYRAAVLVGGMLFGSLVAVDLSAAALYAASRSKGDSAGFLFAVGIGAFLAGLGIMFAAYRAFRYGEQYEYRRTGGSLPGKISQLKDLVSRAQDITSWTGRLN